MSENNTEQQNVNHQPERTEAEEVSFRRQKLAKLREQGIVYANDFKREDLAQDISNKYESVSKEDLEANSVDVVIAGRMMTRRLMGKASFCHLQDMSGKIQVYIRKDAIGDEIFDSFKSDWDLGDFLGVKGTLFKTKTGELSVRASEVRLLTKTLRPLPDKFHGLVDQEQRYRQRYLDLVMNESSRRIFEIRSKTVSFLRKFLEARGFVEVETPMMQVIPGGAAAKPFVTHHNALDMDLYLRIAPELYLKRLVVGGMEKVFEINRNFRNEGLSTRHNPEFTMIEFYQAYATYHELMDLTEELMRELLQEVLGTQIIPCRGVECDFSKPFERMTIKEGVLKNNPELSEEDLDDFDKAKAYAKKLGISIQDSFGLGRIWYEIFEETAEHKLMQPTFVTEFPAEVSPLARKNDDNPFITDRFEFFVGGQELANAFSELNDPEDQAARFMAQAEDRKSGDDEAMYYDEDYILALEHGMPPAAGEGIGIDRLVMLLTNADSIREVLLFPHMRQKN